MGAKRSSTRMLMFGVLGGEVELLVREERREELERDPVAHPFRIAAVDRIHLDEREELVPVARWAHIAVHRIAQLQAELLDLLLASRTRHPVKRR